MTTATINEQTSSKKRSYLARPNHLQASVTLDSLNANKSYVLRLCENHAELWMTEGDTRFLVSTFHNYPTKIQGEFSDWRHRFTFYSRIERELRKLLQNGSIPLVVTGRRFDLYIYRRINTYPWLLELVESEPGLRATKYLDQVQKKIQWILSHLENFITIGNARARRARSSVG